MSETADTTTDDRSSDRSNDFVDELGAILADCGAEDARVEALEDAFDEAIEARVDERVTDLEATAAELRSDIDQLRDEVEAVHGEFDSLRRTTERDLAEIGRDIEALEDELADIDEKWYYNFQDIVDIELRLDDIEDWQESVDTGDLDSDERTQLENLTRLEKMDALGAEHVLNTHQGEKKAKRAIAIAEHFEEWGEKTRKGLVLRCGDHNLKSLLGAERNESLAWKQVHRACRAVMEFTDGKATYFNHDRHGRVLCLHEDTDLYERIRRGTSPLTTSSAETQSRAVSA